MNIYIVSDTHFYHNNIIKYCNRPFIDCNVMNEKMIVRWNSQVKHDDIVIHLGDFVVYGKSEKTLELCNRLNGKKILVRGNHDRRNIYWYLAHGFDFVCDYFVIGKIIFTHRPLYKTNKHILKYYDLNICGHIHQKEIPTKWKYKCKNISVEQTDYYPIIIDKILGEFKLKLKRKNKQGD